MLSAKIHGLWTAEVLEENSQWHPQLAMCLLHQAREGPSETLGAFLPVPGDWDPIGPEGKPHKLDPHRPGIQ